MEDVKSHFSERCTGIPLRVTFLTDMPSYILSTQAQLDGLNYWRVNEVLPRRWVLERTFTCLGKFRRLGKDYEFAPDSSEAIVYLAMIRLMLKRLDKMPVIRAKGFHTPT